MSFAPTTLGPLSRSRASQVAKVRMALRASAANMKANRHQRHRQR
jgi:hypothetical protein